MSILTVQTLAKRRLETSQSESLQRHQLLDMFRISDLVLCCSQPRRPLDHESGRPGHREQPSALNFIDSEWTK